MAFSLSHFFSLVVFAASLLRHRCHAHATFRFDIHHRFSDPVRHWASRTSSLPADWPQKGTFDYYSALAHLDRATLHRRGLAQDALLTFSDGNSTFRIAPLGFLHYAGVSLGTPEKTFLVALDTGSDLFWVPCNCIKCAPTASTYYGFKDSFDFSIYSPNASSTSKEVSCANQLCGAKSECSGDANNCPYKVEYVSTDTSSSGVLVEDIMHMTTENDQHKVDARITFGCGQLQTGSFLDAAAPNGLFGLGMDKISVPSILSAAGLTKDSFSMCFGSDGVGRIIFGDTGSADQAETPFNLRKLHPTYNVSITRLLVDDTHINTSFNALFDSGTSFTYLADPAYTHLTESFTSKIQDKRVSLNSSSIPFEHCYLMSSKDILIPPISVIMKLGGKFSVVDPIIAVATRDANIYCLAVVKSSALNIIGQNFMTGQRIVFDREKFVLGWKKSDCYSINDTSTLPVNKRNSGAMAPSVPVGPGSYTPEATKQTGNESQVTKLPAPSFSSSSSDSSSCFLYTQFILFLLLSVIL